MTREKCWEGDTAGSELREWMVDENKKERGTQSAESLIELFLRIVISINYSVNC